MLLLSICCMMSRHAAIFGLIGCEYAMTNPSLIDERIPQDESGVRRTSGGDEFIVELEGTRPITGSVTDNLDGMWSVALDSARGLVPGSAGRVPRTLERWRMRALCVVRGRIICRALHADQEWQL